MESEPEWKELLILTLIATAAAVVTVSWVFLLVKLVR